MDNNEDVQQYKRIILCLNVAFISMFIGREPFPQKRNPLLTFQVGCDQRRTIIYPN